VVYENIFSPVSNLTKSPVKSGGFCQITLFKKEDVLNWPLIDPITGLLNTAVDLKPGGAFYFIEATEKDKTFLEEEKFSDAGPFFDMLVTSQLGGNSINNTLSLGAMIFHEWGIIVDDRDGNQRLIGNKDSCATLQHGYTSGDISSSRIRKLKWTWQNSLLAPIYSGGEFLISIGGTIVVASCLTLIMRFQVGHPDAHSNPPVMLDGEDELTRAMFANKRLLVLADGIALPCDDGSGDINWTGLLNRHIIKTLASDTVQFFGAASQDEIIEIYVVD